MLREDEINVIKFFNKIPWRFKVLFGLLGLFIGICFCVEFFIPILQKDFINNSIDKKNIYNNSFYFLISLYLSFVFINALSGYCSQLFKQILNKYLFNKYFHKIMNLSKSELKGKGVGYYYDIIAKDCQSASEFFDSKMFDLFFSLMQTIFIFVLLYRWDKIIFLTIFISFQLTIFITFYLFKFRKAVFSDIRESGSVVVKKTLDVLSNNFTIKLFGMLEKFSKTINNRVEINQNHVKRFFKTYSTVDFVLNIIKYLSFLIMLVVLINSIIKNKATYGHLIAYISFFQFIFKPIDYFLVVLGKIANTEVSIKRLNSIKTKKESGVAVSPILLNRIKSMDFRKISFSYRSNQENLLVKDISFQIKNNTKIGIMGLSGEGKSTLLKLLYQENIVSKGKILINENINLYKLPLFQYYNRINVFSQNHEIFNQDLKFNLTLGKRIIDENEEVKKINYFEKIANKFRISFNNENITTKKLLFKMVTDSYIVNYFRLFDIRDNDFDKIKLLINSKEFVGNFIMFSFNSNYISKINYTTIVDALELKKISGRDFGENGSFLSGGEKQKIMFGRFLLKQDYDFFVLDEPFTNLDTINEHKLKVLAQKALKNKMGIIISHKFNLLNNLTSKIIVLKNGRIAESGNHSELLANKELYFEMFQEHKKSYKEVS